MSDVHPRSMILLVLVLMLSALRPADADNSYKRPVAPAAQPPAVAKLTTAQWAKDQGNYKTFLLLVHSAKLDSWLSGKPHYTWILPSDNAFAQLPSGVLDELQKPGSRDLAAQLIKFHAVIGDQNATDLAKVKSVTTAQGETLAVAAEAGKLTQFGLAQVTTSQVALRNGTVYSVGRVLVPASVAKVLAKKGYVVAASGGPSGK